MAIVWLCVASIAPPRPSRTSAAGQPQCHTAHRHTR